MPRKRSRNGNYKGKQLSFRLNKVNATGSGRPWKPKTKMVRSVTSTLWKNLAGEATEIGAHVASLFIDLTQWNAPLRYSAQASFIIMPGLSNEQAPNNHDDAVADLYLHAVIKKSMYRLTVRATPGVATKDFVVMWRFCKDNDVALVPSQSVGSALATFNNIKMSSGWVWRRFSGNQSGGSIYPSSGIIDIKVPSVPRLVHGLNEGLQVAAPTVSGQNQVGSDTGVLVSTTAPPSVAFLKGYILLVFMKLDGSLLVDDEVQIDAMHYMTAQLSYPNSTADNIDEGTIIS